jgi:hypothetical protein
MRRVALLAAAAAAATAIATPSVQGQGLDAAPREARAFVARAIEAMGGLERLRSLRTVAMVANMEKLTERHTLQLRSRFMHYASRRRSGAGFDVVLGDKTFICDRDRRGQATYVEDLSPEDAGEGAYERDVLFLPLLLPQLLDDPGARLDFRGPNSKGDPIVRAAIRTPRGAPGRPFWVRLRFDKHSYHLVQSMGLIPVGADKGQKRYCSYLDYERTAGGLVLPGRYADQRGEAEPREYGVSWELEPEGAAQLFVKPKVN